MLNGSLIKSLCQISALVYKPNSYFVDNFLKETTEENKCFKDLNKQPLFESDIIVNVMYLFSIKIVFYVLLEVQKIVGIGYLMLI